MHQGHLREVFQAALRGEMVAGWIFLPNTSNITLDVLCMVVPDDDDAEVDERGIPLEASRRGFVKEGLNRDMIEDVIAWARRFKNPPTVDVIFEGYQYYLAHDALPAHPGAEKPALPSDILLTQDRRFYDSLGGPSDIECEASGCQRMAITMSTRCRRHHFEMVTGRSCPFDD